MADTMRLRRRKIRTRKVAGIVAATSLVTLLTAVWNGVAVAGETWPEFRGPTGQGHARAANLPTRWNTQRNVQWKQAVPGKGWSSPVVARGKIFVTSAVPVEAASDDEDVELTLVTLDLATGKIVNRVAIFQQDAENAPRIHRKNSHASPTPVVVDDRIYVHFGHQGTACLDFEGNCLWKNRELQYPPVHGNGGSPVVVDDLLIFSCDGGKDPFVVALDRGTGAVRWRTDRETDAVKKFSFSTPLVIEVDGQTQVVSPGSNALCAYDPKSGRELWRVRYDGYSVIPRPVYDHGLVYISTGYDTPSVLAVRPTGSGDVTESHVEWTHRSGAPHTPSLLVDGELLYLVSDRGVATCLEALTGERIWQERVGGSFSASPLLADGKLYLQNEEGVCTVVDPGRSYDELAKNDLQETTYASYAVVDDTLLIRTETQLYRIAAGQESR